jgi:hypothetical protein
VWRRRRKRRRTGEEEERGWQIEERTEEKRWGRKPKAAFALEKG